MKETPTTPLLSLPHSAKLKWFNHNKAFGFAVLDDTQEDVFVHISSIPVPERQEDVLVEGAKLVLDYKVNVQGKRATSVHFLSCPEPQASERPLPPKHRATLPPLTPNRDNYQTA